MTAIQWVCLAGLGWYACRRAPQTEDRAAWLSGCDPYLFYDVAVSICSTCYRKVEGKIVFEDGRVYLLKRCPEHGGERVLMADDVDYYRRCREVFIKPPEMPNVFNTPVRWGCPYDCGLCTDHEQHSCLTLVEITDDCNLQLPDLLRRRAARLARRSGHSGEIERMLDAVVRNEGEPDVVQISGGEPTIHPEFFAILDAAKQRPIKHLMVNTNGMRIAHDEAFAERLATTCPASRSTCSSTRSRRAPLLELRGADLRSVRRQALERLNRLGISTTLVVTLKKGAERRRDRPHRRLRAAAAVRARRHLPADPGGRAAGGLRPGRRIG